MSVGRPKLDPNAPSPSKTPDEAVERGEINLDDIPETREDSVEIQNRIELANGILERKKEVNEELQEIREALTLLTKTGSGSRNQVAWVRFYLPRKKRKKGEKSDTEKAMDAVSGGVSDNDVDDDDDDDE